MAPELIIRTTERCKILTGKQVEELELSANKQFENTRDDVWLKIGDAAFRAVSSSQSVELLVKDEYFRSIPRPPWEILTRY